MSSQKNLKKIVHSGMYSGCADCCLWMAWKLYRNPLKHYCYADLLHYGQQYFDGGSVYV